MAEDPNLDALFIQARTLSEDQRQAFLGTLPSNVRKELESLLAFDSRDNSPPLFAQRMRAVIVDAGASTLGIESSHPGNLEKNAPSPPSTRYPVKGTVGEGGMGIILRVRDEQLRRDIAMKLLRRASESEGNQAPSDATRMRRFVEEAQITGQLDHPGVVPVHELGVDEKGQSYFTMRLVKGFTLGEVFERAKAGDERWTQTRILNALLRVCETVAFAHDRGVIHRDLKPSNIMVGKYGEAYVMDWGLAKVLGQDDKSSEQKPKRAPEKAHSVSIIHTERGDSDSGGEDSPLFTMDGDVVGTPAYMSPEQARGDLQEVAQPSDVYSMGAILYEFLAGERPYRSRGKNLSPRMIHAQVLQGSPDPVSTLAPKALSELMAICDKAMAREIDSRYPNMSLMSEDLSAFLDNRVVKAYRTGAIIELRKWVVRNKSVAAALLTVILLLTVGLATVNIITQRAKREVEDAKNELEFAKSAVDAQNLTLEAQKKELEDQNTLIETQKGELIEEKERAEEETLRAKASLELLTGMLDFADPSQLYGPDYTVLQMLDDFAASLDLESVREMPEVLAELQDKIGTLYSDLGKYDQARVQLEASRDLYETTHGVQSLEYGRILQELSAAVRFQGHYEESEALARQALSIIRAIPDVSELKIALALATLASAVSDQNGSEEAEALQRESLEIRRRLLPPDHPSIAVNLNNLAIDVNEQGKYEEAEALYRDSLEILSRTHEGDHPSIAGTMINLAAVLRRSGRVSEAIEFAERSIAMMRRIYGEHPHVAIALCTLAYGYGEQKNYHQAEALYREALALRKKTLGEEHPLTLSVQRSLADACSELERHSEAEVILRELLAKTRLSPETDHSELNGALRDLGVVLVRQGQLTEGEALFREALEIRLTHNSSKSAIAIGYNELGDVLKDQNKLDEAVALYRQCIDTLLKHPEENDIVLGDSYRTLGAVLRSLSQYPEAEEVDTLALGIFRESFGNKSVDVARMLNLLGYDLELQGKHSEAEVLYRECLDLREILKDDHPSSNLALTGMLVVLEAQGKDREQVPYLIDAERFEDAERIAQDTYDIDDEEDLTRTRECRRLLAQALIGLEKYDEAEPLLIDAYLEWDLHPDLRDSSPQKIEYVSTIIQLYTKWGKTSEQLEWQAEFEGLKENPKEENPKEDKRDD